MVNGIEHCNHTPWAIDHITMFFLIGILILALIIPHAMAAWIPLNALGRAGFSVKKGDFDARPQILWVLLSLLAIMGLSLIWSIDFQESLDKTLKTAGILLAGYLLFASGNHTDNFKHGTLIATMIIVVSSVLMTLDHEGSYILQKNIMPMVDEGFRTTAAFFNKGNIILTLFFWPLLLVMLLKGQRVYASLCFFALVIASFTGASEASKLGLICGTLALVVGWYYPRALAWLILITYAAVSLIAPWVMPYLFETLSEPLMSLWRGASPGARLEIWAGVATQIQQAPLLGHGIEATRTIQNLIPDTLFYKNHSVLHPHNTALQFWIETGVIGVIWHLAVLGWILKTVIAHPSRLAVAVSLACVCCTLVALSTAFGLWQAWWLASLLGLGWYMKGCCAMAEDNQEASNNT